MLADTLNKEDKQSYTYYSFKNGTTQPLVSFRHGAKCNIWYPDGHAAGRHIGEFKNDMFDSLDNIKPTKIYGYSDSTVSFEL